MQYSDAQLYNQLRYYLSLFDIEKAQNVATGRTQDGAHIIHLVLGGETDMIIRPEISQHPSREYDWTFEGCGREVPQRERAPLGTDEHAVLVHEVVVARIGSPEACAIASMYHIPSSLLYRYHHISHNALLNVMLVCRPKQAIGMTIYLQG